MRHRWINKLISLSWPRRLLLCEAALLTALSRISLLLPFRWIAPLLGRHMQEADGETGSSSPKVTDVQWAIAAVSSRVPWQCECLVQAIAARVMLGRRGLSGTMYLGVAKDDEGTMRAHAWLKSGSTVVTGGRRLEKFTVVSNFAFGPRVQQILQGKST